jgi:TRAP-type transport system small permease protein
LKHVLDRCSGMLAGVALFAIMVLTLVDVTGRKLWSASLPGSLELTELLMVMVIFAGLPLVSLHGEHVLFDSFDSRLSATARRVQQALVNLLCAAALAGLAWLMWAKAGQMASYGDITAQLKLPVAPFVYAMAVLCGLTAAVHAALALQPAAPADHSVPLQ